MKVQEEKDGEEVNMIVAEASYIHGGTKEMRVTTREMRPKNRNRNMFHGPLTTQTMLRISQTESPNTTLSAVK